MHLLPPDALIKTSPVDHADWNYRPLLRIIQRIRFRLVLSLLTSQRCGNVLEVGYGSGIFMPELGARSKALYGIDIHPFNDSVASVLSRRGIHATLSSGAAECLPYSDASFDTVVAVSSLEFVDNIDLTCREVNRVLKPGGSFIVVTPGGSPLLDRGLKLLAGVNGKDNFTNRRQSVLPALERHFDITRTIAVPNGISSIFCLYRGLQCARRVAKQELASATVSSCSHAARGLSGHEGYCN